MSGIRRGVWRVAGVGGVILRLETTSEKRRGAGGGVPQMLKEEGLEREGEGKWEGDGGGGGVGGRWGWEVDGLGVRGGWEDEEG